MCVRLWHQDSSPSQVVPHRPPITCASARQGFLTGLTLTRSMSGPIHVACGVVTFLSLGSQTYHENSSVFKRNPKGIKTEVLLQA